MAKFTTILTESPNAIRVNGGYFPLPLVRRGPTAFGNIVSADYGINPINGEKLICAPFEWNAELASYAFRQRDNLALSSVINAINGSGKVLTGNSIFVTTPTKVYFVQFPANDLVKQFGVNDQKVLDKTVAEFKERLKGCKEKYGVVWGDGIRMISTKGVPSGDIDKNDFKPFPGLVGIVGSMKTAQGIARAGREDYSLSPYFSLNIDQTNLATRVPVLGSVGFVSGLYVGGGYAGCSDRCSFGGSVSGAATRAK